MKGCKGTLGEDSTPIPGALVIGSLFSKNMDIWGIDVRPAPLNPHIRKYDFGCRRGAEMSESKHTEAQIIAALKQVETGRTAEDEAWECGVSKHTICDGCKLAGR